MPHSFGYRAHTRDLFQKKFRKHGLLPTQTYLKIFRVGQIVDLAGDGGVHKGMQRLRRAASIAATAALRGRSASATQRATRSAPQRRRLMID